MNAKTWRRPASAAGVARLLLIALVAVIVAIPCATHAAGFARNENLIVFAPDQSLAEDVLAKADHFRAEIAEQWLGEELPCGAGRTLVHVKLSDAEESGLTWVKDPDDSRQTLHRVWLTTTQPRALGSMLGHEMTHVVFATKFPERLPPWIEEAIASFRDDPTRATSRRRILRRYAETGNWPRLKEVFDAQSISARNDAAYCVGPSVVEYLLSRGDKQALLRFAVAAKKKGWQVALRECYGFTSLADLEVAWQAWATQAAKAYAGAAPPTSDGLAAIRPLR